jgi:hypothetical protein
LGPRAGSGEAERELLGSPKARRKMEAHGVELITYADLVRVEQRAAA